MANVDAIFSRLNPLIGAILRSPLHWIASAGIALITVTGRRTGRRYTIPVGYQLVESRVVILVSEARGKQWWRNYHQPGRVELLVKRQTLTGEARSIDPHDAEFRDAFEHTLRRAPAIGRAFGIRFDATGGLSDDQLSALRENAAAIIVELDHDGAPPV